MTSSQASGGATVTPINPRENAPLPIADRVGADPRFTGRGIVAAFLDSGFYAHPDLTSPESRILAYHDLVHDRSGTGLLSDTKDPSAWHGMMSTVVAAGNGALSTGKFRSLAPDLQLVLVKVGTLSRVLHDNIARGIEWVLRHRAQYNIRILNISCGGDYEVSHLEDNISLFAEAAIRAGVTIVAAVGNNGHRPGYVLPPASVPAVVSVGGLDDSGDPRLGRISGYRSSYGPTVDGIQKPEIITLADWIAAPILPGTPTARQAAFLTELAQAKDEELGSAIARQSGIYPPLDEAKERPAYLLRQIINVARQDHLVIDQHYKMVDGTSFSAPIVTSVVAQMLEANPRLKPQEVKRILVRTARRIPNIEFEKQGWGAIQPKVAVEKALEVGRV